MRQLDLHGGAWFCALGEPLNDAERAWSRDYLQGLGFAAATPLRAVGTWLEALRVSNDPGWSEQLWRAEQAERARLLAALEAPARAGLETASFESMSDRLQGSAAIAAARMGFADQGAIRAAAGAATEAVYHAELARAAQAGEDHPFVCKLALFASGHWPLVLVENYYYIF